MKINLLAEESRYGVGCMQKGRNSGSLGQEAEAFRLYIQLLQSDWMRRDRTCRCVNAIDTQPGKRR